MKPILTEKFEDDFSRLPLKIQNKITQKLNFLELNIRHPSIKAKKMEGKSDTWEGRIDIFYRFTFRINESEIILLRVGPHDEALR